MRSARTLPASTMYASGGSFSSASASSNPSAWLASFALLGKSIEGVGADVGKALALALVKAMALALGKALALGVVLLAIALSVNIASQVIRSKFERNILND